MDGEGEEGESGALREQGMRAGPISNLSSPNFFASSHAVSAGVIAMPTTDDQEALERAREDAREGNSISTQAGEFVREEIAHVREGKHGAANVKQAIAIGLSKARRAGVNLRLRPRDLRKFARRRSATCAKANRRFVKFLASVRARPCTLCNSKVPGRRLGAHSLNRRAAAPVGAD
jgi:hypothetical protein